MFRPLQSEMCDKSLTQKKIKAHHTNILNLDVMYRILFPNQSQDYQPYFSKSVNVACSYLDELSFLSSFMDLCSGGCNQRD